MNYLARVCALALIHIVLAFCLSAVVPVGELAKDADLIVLGKANSISHGIDGRAVFSVMVDTVLKGKEPSVRIQAVLPESRFLSPGDVSLKTYGIEDSLQLWFLRLPTAAEGEISVIPVVRGDWSERNAFIRVETSWTPPAGQSLDAQLLNAALNSFEASTGRELFEDARLVMSAEQAPVEEALALSERMLRTPRSVDSEALGIAIALSKSQTLGLIELKERIPRIEGSPMFRWVLNALGDYYVPRDPGDVRALIDIVRLGNDPSLGIDAAIARVLSKHRGKITVPALVQLLDSPDATVRLYAVHGLHVFAALAGPDGEIHQGRASIQPFRSEETRLHSGRKSVPLDASVAFWKSWWERNRARIENQTGGL